jgi:hypothetical protein
MIFLNFSQLSESVFRPNFPRKHFLGNQTKFSFDCKCFPLINFSNDKQTHESLESDKHMKVWKVVSGMTNKHMKVWKVVSRKPLSGKQTWP